MKWKVIFSLVIPVLVGCIAVLLGHVSMLWPWFAVYTILVSIDVSWQRLRPALVLMKKQQKSILQDRLELFWRRLRDRFPCAPQMPTFIRIPTLTWFLQLRIKTYGVYHYPDNQALALAEYRIGQAPAGIVIQHGFERPEEKSVFMTNLGNLDFTGEILWKLRKNEIVWWQNTQSLLVIPINNPDNKHILGILELHLPISSKQDVFNDENFRQFVKSECQKFYLYLK